jgi:hypothetical protein
LRRTENAARDAADARTFFGGNLNHPDANGAFQYLKRSQTHVLSKDDAIAKKWRELLESDPVIALRFTQMRLSPSTAQVPVAAASSAALNPTVQ